MPGTLNLTADCILCPSVQPHLWQQLVLEADPGGHGGREALVLPPDVVRVPAHTTDNVHSTVVVMARNLENSVKWTQE